MRQYPDIPAPNAAANIPGVSALTGAGTGAGAAVQTSGGGNFGEVWIYAGTSPAAGGSVAITFPSTPPVLFVSGSPESFGTITQATVGNVVTVSWTGTLKNNGMPYKLSYEWFNYLSAAG